MDSVDDVEATQRLDEAGRTGFEGANTGTLSLLDDLIVDGLGHGEADLLDEVKATERLARTEIARKPAWEDEEEVTAVVNVTSASRLRKLRTAAEEVSIPASEYAARLRVQHAKLNPGNSWAELPWQRKVRQKQEDGDDVGRGLGLEDEEGGVSFEGDEPHDRFSTLLEQNDLVVKSKVRLPQGLVEISRMKDANTVEPSDAVIQSVEFHRNAQLFLTAGFDKKIRFFQIDGKRNPKVQSLFLQDFPIHKAAFVPDGSGVVAAGRRNFFFVYDLEAGRVERVNCLIGRDEKSLECFEVSPDSKVVAFLGNEGYILLTSLRTRQCIGTLKMNGTVRSVSFSSDGKELLSIGGDGEVYHWDLRNRRCFHRGQDEGCIKSTALEVSPDNSLFATGSGSGVVNLYNKERFLGGGKMPLKAFMNLTTNIDNLRFSSDSQILAMSSRMQKDALRLVHVPSKTVFSNWPSPKTPLQYVHSMAFSPGEATLQLVTLVVECYYIGFITMTMLSGPRECNFCGLCIKLLSRVDPYIGMLRWSQMQLYFL